MRVVDLLAVVLLAATVGCAADDRPSVGTEPSTPPSTTSATTGTATSAPSPAGGLVVRTAGSDYGQMLFDARGQAIYLFDKESSRRARCYGECARAWPPVLTQAMPRAEGKVRPGLLGTTRRRDGSLQVTYGGHPLYYYAHEGPRQVLCHDVVEYGGRWLVVTPSGKPAA